MKKMIKKGSAFLLALLMLCSMVNITLPVSVDAAATSNWYMGGGTTTKRETTEIWVVDTATVNLAKVNGFVQNTQKLTELIGKDGKDGKGYFEVTIDDGTAAKFNSLGYCVMQLVGSKDTSSAIPFKGNSQGVSWYIRSSEEAGDACRSIIYNNVGVNNPVVTAAYSKDFDGAGQRFLFTTKDDGKVYIRGNGIGVADSFDDYTATASVASEVTLANIVGDNNETGEDGVYARFHTKTSSVDLKVTVTVVYPMPADYDATKSHWAVGGGSTILSESTEYLAVDTIRVSMPANTGYIQHKEKLTDLIGENGKDGKGFVNVIVGDGTTATSATSYVDVMFVGKADPSIAVPANTINNQSLIWYLRPDGNGTTQTQGRIANAVANAACEYGSWTNFGAEGFRMAFTKYSDNSVKVRGIGNGMFNNVSWYSKNVNVGTKLTDVEGDNGETAADGVYLRLHTRRGSAVLDATVTVAYPCEAPTQTVPDKNWLPEDLFKSSETLKQWFGGSVSTDAAHYTVEDSEYVYYAPVQNGWPYTLMEFPDGSFTVKMKIKPETYESSGVTKYGGMGILLGYETANHFPWMNIRFDANYETKKMKFYVWENDGKNAIVAKEYGTDWYKGEFPEDMWFEVKFEFTNNGTKIYLDGYQAPDLTTNYTPPESSLGHFPQADELTYIGLFPSGTGHYIKNFEMYEGVEADINAAVPELKESITLHMQAEVNTDSTEPVRMKFDFKGEEIWAEGVQSGNQYTFSLPNILPQDMGETISAELYIGDTLKDTVSDYSMKQYCMNQLALSTDEDVELRAMLVSILNYGAAAQTYFEKDVDNLATKDLTADQKAYLSDYDISQATGVITDLVTGTPDANYTWNAATLSLENLIKVRLKFTATDIENTRIKIGEVIYDAEDFVATAGGKYFVYTEGIYATDFNKTITAMFVDAAGNQVGEKVEYSVNTYLSYASGLEGDSLQALVQAIYNYGMASVEYGKI